MGFFGKLWTVIRGWFIRAGDDLVSGSPEAIKSTYAAAITDAQKRYSELEGAVALLARERERTEERLKSLEREEADLQRRLEGALTAAEADPDNPAHRDAGIRFQTRLGEIDAEQEKLSIDLQAQRVKVEQYKGKLRGFRSEIDRLKREQGEVVAEWVSAQQMVLLEKRLQGLSDTTVDQSIIAIRDKVANLKAHAKIAQEMGTTSTADTDYDQLGAKTVAASKFDEMLQSRRQTNTGKEKERDLG